MKLPLCFIACLLLAAASRLFAADHVLQVVDENNVIVMGPEGVAINRGSVDSMMTDVRIATDVKDKIALRIQEKALDGQTRAFKLAPLIAVADKYGATVDKATKDVVAADVTKKATEDAQLAADQEAARQKAAASK